MAPKTSLPSVWDKQAADWDRGIHSPEWPHYHYYKTFDIYLGKILGSCKRVLELGSGTADSTINFSPHVREIFASDFSKEMIRIAAGKLKSSSFGDRVHLAVFDAQGIPLRGGSFDGVFSRGALLNYVPNPKGLLDEIHRILIRSGKLVIDMISGRPGGEATLYSKNQVETLLKDSGFSSIDFRPMGMFLNLWQNRDLMAFINKHRDIFCRIEAEMNDAFRLDRSTMILITARKSDRSFTQAPVHT